MHWQRAIILVDMNAFFASIEQLDFPQLRNLPVVVTNGTQGTCIITSSYEARSCGIKTGMRLKEARRLCPNLIQRPSRPQRYVAISRQIMAALHNITPDMEIFSIDEAFLDITRCQRLHGTPETIGRMVQKAIDQSVNLPCSIGISGDKTTAKFAAKLQKPNGFTVIPPWQAKQRLHNVPVTELCGIAQGIGNFLAARGVYTCGDMSRLPLGTMAQRFGNLGRRIWYMCQGLDPDPVHTTLQPPKSIGHGKVLPPRTCQRREIEMYLRHMSEKVAARLRRHNMQAQLFLLGLRLANYGWLTCKSRTAIPTDCGRTIYKLCLEFLRRDWQQQPINQVQVTALNPQPETVQLDLFTSEDTKQKTINNTIDTINNRYGEAAITPATLINKPESPNVIAPSWQPDGHRQTV